MLRPFSAVIFSLILAICFYFGPPVQEAQESTQKPAFASDSFTILHYTINLNIPDVSSGMISGITDVQLKPMSDSLKKVVLQLKGLKVDSVWIDEESVSGFEQNNDLLQIHFTNYLIKGTTIILTVFYHGIPTKDPRWGGVYFTQNTAFVMGVCMSLNPPSGGRLWFPCVDDFRSKASYDYFITVSDTLSVVCPGILQNTISEKNHEITYHWSIESPIPTYLSAFAVSNYAVIYDTLQGEKNEIPAAYFVPKKDSSIAVSVFSNVPSYLKTFESLFGPYSWSKIGYVGVPFAHGAMEHATCIFIPDNILKNNFQDEDLLVHEFAHNWFGNLVTCARESDMWLNEGFASYCVALYHEDTEGENAYKNYIRHLHRNVLQHTPVRDGGYYAVSHVPLKLTYGSTVYDKGADMIHNLRSYLGDQRFFEALKLYLKEFAWSNASTLDFEHFLSQFSRKPMDEFFNTWIYQPGFPHFSVHLNNITKIKNGYSCSISISQQKLARKELSFNVPLEITLLDSLWNEDTFTVYLSGKEETFYHNTMIKPAVTLLDMNEKINDATISQYKVLKTPCVADFPDCFFRMSVKDIQDSVFFNVVHHWIAPVGSENIAGYHIFQDQYWSIDGLFYKDFSATGTFSYRLSNPAKQFKNTANIMKKMVLLYRPTGTENWQQIPATISGDPMHGDARIPKVLRGEYCLALKKNQE